MSQNGPFGVSTLEDFDRLAREAGEGLRDALDRFGKRAGWATLIDQFTGQAQPAGPETTGDAGDGVWAIYTVDADGRRPHRRSIPPSWTRCGQNKNNTDPVATGCVSCRTESRSVCSTRPNSPRAGRPAH